MESLLFLFSDYTFLVVALGSALMGLISGVLGSFAVLQRKSLLGDGVAHAALPGVILAFLFTGSKKTEILLLGALITGFLATLFILAIVKNSRIKFDSALAFIMSVFFGLGLVLLTYVQKIPDSSQAGLKRFIFGQASTLLKRDVIFMAICGSILLTIIVLFWKEFKLITFDGVFAESLGLPLEKLNMLLSFLIVIGIIIGLQTVGVVLMSAMLISPAVAARQWTQQLWTMVVLSAIFGILSGVIGTAASSLIPQLPTGPTIVICISLITCISLLFAPSRGILSRILRQRNNRTISNIKRRKTNVTSI